MSECKFAVEAFHAYIESIGLSRPAGTLGELKAFKAGAEWQRSQEQEELAALKSAQVVMPERWNVPRPMWKDARQPYGNPLNHADIEAAEKFNLALDEVARLNAIEYAAPVSEAKAQGVVMPQSPHWPGDDSHLSDYERGHLQGRCDMRSEVIRLNAAPVQQVSVPDVLREAIKWADHLCFECGALVQTRAPSVHVYNKTFEAVQAAKAMLAAAPAAPAADAGLVDMYRHLQTVTPYRFKKIQDASITDGGDVMYFHKDRFDAALLADMAAHCAAKGVV